MKYKSCVRKIINKYQRPIKPLKKKERIHIKNKKREYLLRGKLLLRSKEKLGFIQN